MDIIFNPPVNEANKYIAIMVRPLRESGYHVHPLDDIFSSSRHFRSIALVHLNWFENLDDTAYSKMLISFFRKILVLSVLKMSGKKLVWTMHNRVSHEKKSGKLSRILTGKLIRYTDAIVIHSKQSESILLEKHPTAKAKIHYLPHPDFIDSYGAVEEEKLPDHQLKLLFIGAVKPYKNIELLIKTAGQFGDKVELTVAGNPNSEAYKQQLTQLASEFPQVKLRLGFIPDSEIPALIGGCDLLILPYDLNSSLNSGTVLLAFSYQKSVICPEIGTLSDMREMQDHFLSYVYKSEDEHAQKIHEMIELAYQMKLTEPEVFKRMGIRMFLHVQQNHSKALVADQLKKVYQSILG